DDGHRDVIFDRFQDVELNVIEEGTHFMIPWLHRAIIFDIRTRPRSVPSITEIKDLQTINITLRILHRPRAELLPKIFCKLGELLIERAAQFGLLLDISITHLSFRSEFTSAVELKRRFLVEKTEQSRQANVIAAEGDARTADLIDKALDEAGDEKEDQINNSLDDIKDSSTIEMMNFDNLFRRFILTQSFVRGWGNPFHLQDTFTYRRGKIGKQKGNQNYINARFGSPLANYLPHLVPSQVATAHFQFVLSRDHRFGIDSIPIRICYAGTGDHGSILLENPYYDLRKPQDQSRSSLLYVTNLYIMGEELVLETLMLLHWCQKMKLTPAILHDFSLGGYMASLAFTKWPDPPSRQFYENKASQTFYDYLRERNQSIDLNKIVLDLIKDMMRLLMDEFTSLHNHSRLIQSNIPNVMFIACTHDGISHMNDAWPGIHIRYILHGHVSAFLFNQSGLYHAAAKMLQRQESNVKLKKTFNHITNFCYYT
ncbi:unnamed protein product, partial [Rotaria sordida]